MSLCALSTLLKNFFESINVAEASAALETLPIYCIKQRKAVVDLQEFPPTLLVIIGIDNMLIWTTPLMNIIVA